MPATLVSTSSSLSFKCRRKDLHECVQTVAHAVSNRSSLPILSHVLIKADRDTGQLTITANDTEMGILLHLDDAEIDTSGACTAPARMLNDLLGAMSDGELDVSMDLSHAIWVKTDNSKYRILGLPADEYPGLREVPDDNQFVVAQSVLRDMIRKTIFAVSTDETRPILTGVLMELSGATLKMVGTDTHRLALRTAPVEDSRGAIMAIVPARAMNELSRILTDDPGQVTVSVSDKDAVFVTPSGVRLVTRLIEGQYPNYERVIPSDSAVTSTLKVQTQQMLMAIRRASFVAKNDAFRVRLKADEQFLTVRAESPMDGTAYEEVEMIREGDDVEIAFNAKYLVDVISVIDGEGMLLQLTETMRPGMARTLPGDPTMGDGTYLCVLMPMQTQ